MQKNKNIILGIIYRTPSQNTDIFNKYFLELSSKLNNNKHKLICIMGDFNFDLLKFSINNNINKFLDDMIASFLYPTISTPTRITPTTKTLIDNIFCNTLNSINSGCIYSDLSDHSLIFASIKLKNNLNSYNVPPRQYRLINDQNSIHNYREEVTHYLSHNPVNNDTNDILKSLTQTLNSLADKYFPLKTQSRKKTPIQPWVTAGILQSIKTKIPIIVSHQLY